MRCVLYNTLPPCHELPLEQVCSCLKSGRTGIRQQRDHKTLGAPVIAISTHDGRFFEAVDAALGVLADIAHRRDHA